MKITFRQLQVFDAVATLGSVTAAADRLNMSQSAASAALSDLQIVLGRTLFAHARGRPVQITDEGRRLHPMARSLLAQASDIEQDESASALSGRLVIGATASIAETVLPKLCVEFMRLHPAVQVRVDVEAASNLLERLARFDLETALIESVPEVEGLELVHWRSDEMILVVGPDHPLADRQDLKIEDLASHTWCTREPSSSTMTRLRYLLHERIGSLPVAYESTSNWAVRHAVIAGGGIGCLSRALVQFDLLNGRLRQLNLADFTYTRSLSLARPRQTHRGRLVRAFERYLLDQNDLDG